LLDLGWSPSYRDPVQFQISHELDAPVEEAERALLSPELGPQLARRSPKLESVQMTVGERGEGQLRRVLRFHARSLLPALERFERAREWMMWEEHLTYQLSDHAGQWCIVPRGDAAPDAIWRRRFALQGTMSLKRLADRRSRRIVAGDMDIQLRIIGRVLQRIAVAELHKAYDAEAEVLRTLCKTA